MKKTLVIFLLSLFFCTSCFLIKKTYRLPENLESPDPGWIDLTINSLSLDQKIGQMLMPLARNDFYSRDKTNINRLKKLVTRYYIGGFFISKGSALEHLKFINELQSLAKVPLFFAADFESGVNNNTKGGTPFISMMGVGATGNPQHAFEIGKITALEARAIGINLIFAPIADISLNALNKINIQSFGENPSDVSQFVSAFTRGVQENGALATVKHFPGYGACEEDSHYDLPTLDVDLSLLQKRELVPFIEAIKSGVSAIMTAHFLLPKISEKPDLPATLSWKIIDELLREKLHFDGLVITDVMAKKAVKNNFYEGKSIVEAVHAGNDILLMPQNLSLAFHSIRQAVQRREISMERINQSVRRILLWKSRLGLQNNAIVPEDAFKQQFFKPSFFKKSDEIARDAVTLVRNECLPVKIDKNPRILVLSFADNKAISFYDLEFVQTLTGFSESITHVIIDQQVCKNDVKDIFESVSESDYIINTFHFKRTVSPVELSLSDNQTILLDSIITHTDSVINVFYGSPYFSMNFPQMKNILYLYKDSPQMQRIGAEAIIGQHDIHGKLPATIPKIANIGEGEQVNKYSMQMEKVDYKRSVRNYRYLDSLKYYLQQSITDGAFPGCAIAVGYKGNLVFSEGFGHFIYDQRSKKVETNSIFDLASVTKVVSTTSAAMALYERDLLNLDWKVQEILPGFSGKEKGFVTIRHLLTHSSGLPAWKKYYLTLKGQENILKAIYAEELEYTPGTLSMYSDLGMIMMQKIIEVISQKPLNMFVHNNIYHPLEMDRTFYKPEKSFFNEIVPTEKSEFHKIVIRGFVHDENTYVMGGVSGHAGLFSTVDDLAKYCQMLLNGGIYNQKRIYKQSTIELFAKREGKLKGSTRAIGWDTRSEEKSSAGHFMSMKTFGHLGFTGTSIWLDPVNEVFVVFLTNRVHPTRENQKIRKVRPIVHDYVMKAILGDS